MAETNKRQEGSAAGEMLLAQGTSGHRIERCTQGGRFPFGLDQSDRIGPESVGMIGRLRMPANGGNVLGILLSMKNFSGKVGEMPVVLTERHIRTK